ncbi:MAG TPA: hypothetical protein VGE11_16905 [Pseudonocardia sp.]
MVDRPRLDQLITLLAGYVRILRQAERVYEIIGTRLADFDRFAEQIAAYADRA